MPEQDVAVVDEAAIDAAPVAVVVEHAALTGLLAAVAPAISKGPPYNAVLVTVERGQMRVSAGMGDLRLEITRELPGMRRTAHAFVQHPVLARILRTLPRGPVEIGFGHPLGLLIHAGDVSVAVPVMGTDPSQFGIPKRRDGEVELLRGDDRFLEAIRNIEFAASDDEMRPVLTNIGVDREYLCATDSYRLAIAPHHLEHLACDFQFPTAAIPLLPSEGTVEIRGDRPVKGGAPVWLSWDVGPLHVECRTVGDMPFPNWRTLIPDELEQTLTVDRGKLLAAVRAVESWSNIDLTNQAPTVALVPAGAFVQVQHNHEPRGVIDVPAELVGWEPMAFNPTFLREMLEAFTAEEIVIEGQDALKPVIVEDDDDDMAVLLMPIRVSETLKPVARGALL